MNNLIAGRIASGDGDPWSAFLASFGDTVISMRCLTEKRLPYTDAHGREIALIVPKGATVTLYCNFDRWYDYRQLRAAAEKSRHALLTVKLDASCQVTLFNDNTLQFRNPTPRDVRPGI